MFLHLGNDQVISGDQIIAILNLEEHDAGQFEKLIETAQQARQLTNIGKNGKKKALVLCNDRVYLSPISSHTLYKRGINYHKES